MNGYRQPHAPSNLDSRKLKGLKIERLLTLWERPSPIRILEIGTGSGGIAHYFGAHKSLVCTVHSIDVVDIRTAKDGYTFQKVKGTALPYGSESFDVVLSNHVIEHVGTLKSQLHHLKEIRRVLHPKGTAYLSLPNRWMLIEPHYRLAFLSWLPRSLRTPYLKFRKYGNFYDCEPLSLKQIEALLAKAKLKGVNICPNATLETFDIEKPNSLATFLIRKTPRRILQVLNPINPTLVYTLRKDS